MTDEEKRIAAAAEGEISDDDAENMAGGIYKAPEKTCAMCGKTTSNGQLVYNKYFYCSACFAIINRDSHIVI